MNKILAGFILVAVAAVLYFAAGFSATGEVTDVKLPAFASSSPVIKEAYTFAVQNPGALDGVKCYCGCMMHAHGGRIHKRGLLDCFLQNDGSFEVHASECDMCIKDALAVKKWMQEGKSKEEIKNMIDAKYRGSSHG